MVGDFETTTTPDDVRVWASCLVDIDSGEVLDISNSIEGFIAYISNKNSKVYFHNLKFDGEFIIHYLLTNGYTHTNTKEPKTFNTLITDNGVFYQITIYFQKYNKRYKKCVIQDSLKKLPFSVAVIAKTFDLEESKLSIDYKAYRPVGHILTPEEREYVTTDCIIVAKALKHQFDTGLDRMTIGSDALNGFKSIISKKRFEQWFPVLPLEVDNDIRRAYKGGFTYLNPKFKNKRLEGLVYDVNSLYPSVMRFNPMPYGYPIFYHGEYVPDKHYPLYIQRIRCEFKVKRGHIPTIQLKKNRLFVETEYLKSSNGEIVEMTLTSVDLKLFLAHYKPSNLEYICGYKFKQCEGVFNGYIDYWANVKANSKGGTRQLAKLMLNNLYGKFATNPLSITKIPYLDDKEIVRYKLSEPDFRDSVYTAVGAFITAYARYKTITTAQSLYKRFIYADTDSIHLVGHEAPTNIVIHDTDLGAWKLETTFIDSKFLRAKTYLETNEKGMLQVKCAGMPDNVKENVTYDNFTLGASFSGKLTPKRYKGGVVLQDSNFTIKH
jgi:hypothetical protein